MTSFERRSRLALVAAIGGAIAGCPPPVLSPDAAGGDATGTDGGTAFDAGGPVAGDASPIEASGSMDRSAPTDRPIDAGRDASDVANEDGAFDAAGAYVPCAAPSFGGVPAIRSPVARLIFPLANHTVTTHRPDLRWALAGGDGATVELCRDRPCTSVAATFDVVGTHSRPPASLDPGVYFWRIFERTGDVRSATPSATWYFHVDARDTPVDTAWDSGLDVNGDGFHDFYINLWDATVRSQTHLFLGGVLGLTDVPGPAIDGRITSMGDVNGDGYPDFLGSTVYAGGPTGSSMASLGSIATTNPNDRIESLGDVNDDGYGDVLVAGYESLEVRVLPGGPTGVGPVPILVASPVFMTRTEPVIRGLNDVNGDRRGDFIVGTIYDRGALQRTSGLWLSGTPWRRSVVPGCELWEDTDAVSMGDLNGDGYADLTSYCRLGLTRTRFAAGGSCDEFQVSDPVFEGSIDTGYRGRFEPIGDVNGDGRVDIQLLTLSVVLDSDSVIDSIHYGLPGPTVALTRGTRSFDGQAALHRVYDVNGDGYDDVLHRVSRNETWLLLGGPSGPSPAPFMIFHSS